MMTVYTCPLQTECITLTREFCMDKAVSRAFSCICIEINVRIALQQTNTVINSTPSYAFVLEGGRGSFAMVAILEVIRNVDTLLNIVLPVASNKKLGGAETCLN